MRMVTAVALVAAAGVVSAATPAQAVTGLAYVNATSAVDSSAVKTLTLTCAAGQVAIGGGAYVTGATGDVTIREIRPALVAGAVRLIVTAQEDPDGFAGSWRLDATAVCIPQPAGLAFVSGSMTDPALVWATASCGAKRIIGSGYSVSNTGAVKAAGLQIASNRAYISAEPSRVAGAVVPVTGRAVAVCADAALPGMTDVTVETAQNSSDGKSATATCPAGTAVIGVGGDLFRFRNHTVIDDFRISPASNAVTVTGYEDQAGNPDVWAATATAVCAT
jgi:hypothetical protein